MIKPHNTNTEFALSGINHVALVCSDMARTVDFYSNTLGMPLIKALDLPGAGVSTSSSTPATVTASRSSGLPTPPTRCPAISAPRYIPGIGDIVSAVSSMNHLSFHVPAEKFDEYRRS